jgi:mannose-1-phosphate guanylyltransferase/mannose-1-phosphate guanylyltransferase/mannose-6-phosphate isomerase
MTQQARAIHPVLLAGGAGARLWPLSRGDRPKPFLALVGETSLLRQTAARVAAIPGARRPVVIAGVDHRFLVAEQLREGDFTARVVLEPVGRNTALAAAVGALLVQADDPDGLVLIAPGDHLIGDLAGYLATLETARAAAEGGRIVLIGVAPTRAETGYGYIRAGQALGAGASAVAGFVEKPAADVAERLAAGGDHLWNAGMVLASAALLVQEIERHAPATMACARRAVAAGVEDADFLRLDAAAVGEAASISLDHAVLEKTDRAAVVRAQFDWADVGAWSTLWDLAAPDADGNVLVGAVRTSGVSGSYVRSEGPVVAAVGVKDLVIVATASAVLVAARGADAAVKALAADLAREG